jgi:hypothetical protein
MVMDHPHSQEHFHDIGNANRLLPRPLIFPEYVHLSAGDLIALDGILVFNEAACDLGR